MDFIFTTVILLQQAIYIAAGFPLVLAGVFLAGNDLYWRLRARRVEGSIAGVRHKGSVYHTVYNVVIDGQALQPTAHSGSSLYRGRETGRAVTLMYFPDEPLRVRQTGGLFQLVLGLAFVGMGTIFLYEALQMWEIGWGALLLPPVIIALWCFKNLRKPPPEKQTRLQADSETREKLRVERLGPVAPIEDVLARHPPAQGTPAPAFLPPLLVVLGLGALVFAGMQARDLQYLEAHGVRAEGRIVRMDRQMTSNDTTYAPVVAFTDTQGRKYEFTDRVRSSNPTRRKNHKTTVLYDPSTPQATARVDRGRKNWLVPGMIGGGGVLCLGIAFLAHRDRQRRLESNSLGTAAS